MSRTLAAALLAVVALLHTACADAGAADTTPTPAVTPTPTQTPAPTPTATPTPQPTPAPAPPSLSAQEVLESAITAMAQVQTAHFEMDIEVGLTSGETSVLIPIKFSGDMAKPDRIKGSLSLTAVFLTINTEIVSIGGTTYYTNISTGEWDVLTVDAPFFLEPNQLVEGLRSAIQDLALSGLVTLDGSQVYQLTATNPPGVLGEEGGEFQIGLWIGVDDGLLAQITVQGETDNVGPFVEGFTGFSVEPSGAVSITLKLSEYGKPVSIEAPK